MKPRAYYNENNKHAAAWLRELIADGLIPAGDVDDRSIVEVSRSDLDPYTQAHFFAGIGGWALALRYAGWPDDAPVWTGSCPCQDFSNAGKRARFEGDRDLWPVWFNLIRECKPDALFGEQVDDSIEWFDRAAADLEGQSYAVGATVIPACAIGAACERYRLFFAAYGEGFNGPAHDRVVPRNTWRAPAQPRRLSSLHVAGGRWRADTGADSLPTLVRNSYGVPALLAGLGNAIVPEVAATFIEASLEAIADSREVAP